MLNQAKIIQICALKQTNLAENSNAERKAQKKRQINKNTQDQQEKQRIAYFNQVNIRQKYVPWPTALIDRIRKRIFKPSFVIC